MSRYYLGRSEIPKVIAVDELPEDSDLIRDLLEKTAGKKVRLFVPQRGQQRQLLEMAYHNAAEQLSQKTSYSAKEVAALDELGKLLGLPEPPNYIESYDISNLGDSGVVAGMVVFENAQPLKSAYKRFSNERGGRPERLRLHAGGSPPPLQPLFRAEGNWKRFWPDARFDPA